jgi:DUF1680 family protein
MRTGTILIFFSVLAFSCTSEPKKDAEIDLPKEWKFQTGDDADYSKPEFKDVGWKTIIADKYWETQGFTDYDGIAWYRVQVVIPSSLRSDNELLKTLKISLGRIDDSDETYFNGTKIGGINAYDAERSYTIPPELIQWDKKNLIAVRVNDTGWYGGIYGGPLSIGNVKLSDMVILKTNDLPSEFSYNNSVFHKTILFQFKNPVDILKGTLNVKIYEPNSNTIVFQKEENLEIGQKADTSYSFEVSIAEPDNYKIDYVFTEKTLGAISYSTLFSYILIPREHVEFPVVNLLVPSVSEPFELEHLSFGGYLNERLQANLMQRLLKIDETGILECYYNRPGKQTWIGEYTGKYLHAASRVWRSTQNTQLKIQMDRIVDILIACQNPDGYLGTYLPANYWTDWDVWAHKYNMLGLLSYYEVTGYKPALMASVKMGDLLCATFGENEGQLNIINSSGHVGMASTSVLEPMTYLYRYTGNEKYMDFCNYIIKAYEYEIGPKIISTLTTVGKVDKTANAKAYEMMSNLTGIVKLYQLTGNEALLKAAENAWKDISTNKLYITGTASKAELFREDFVLPAENDDHMGEGCVTTTWIQFSQALYYLTGNSKYIDEIEKSVYNHLFAAENPQTGCVSYYTALQGVKPYRCTIHGHCCLASVPRGIAAIPELAITRNAKNGFSINLYSEGILKDSIKTSIGKMAELICIVESKFPEKGLATITLNPSVKSSFRVALRVPAWCKNFKAVSEGKTYKGVPGQYLNIDKTWEKNSDIRVSFDMTVQVLKGEISYPGYVAIKAGPQVLAFDKALNRSIKDVDKLTLSTSKPIQVSEPKFPKGWVGSRAFKIKAFYRGAPVDLILVPFADAGQSGGEVRVWIKKK